MNSLNPAKPGPGGTEPAITLPPPPPPPPPPLLPPKLSPPKLDPRKSLPWDRNGILSMEVNFIGISQINCI